MTSRMRLDPVLIEVLWSRVLSVVNEQQVALQRTAFSTIVRETQDLACGVFDTNGWMMAQSVTGTPGHINAMATGVRHFLEAYPLGTLRPGDVLITNDPWMTAGQINDITVVTPVFKKGVEVAYFANTCHAADIGGRILSAEAREVYEEGLRIPIMKLYDRGDHQPGPDIDRQGQRPDPGRDCGRSIRPDLVQRCGGSGPARLHGRVRSRHDRSALPRDHHPLGGGHAQCHPRDSRMASISTKPGATGSKTRS